MEKKTKIILGVSSILLVAAGIGTALYFRNRNKKKEQEELEEEEYGESEEEMQKLGGALGEPDESEYSSKKKLSGSKELKFGAKGRRVALLQALLNHYEGQNLKIDGAFGNQTRVGLMNAGWKFRRCVPSAAACKVTENEFMDMMRKSKGDTSFKKKYNINTNPAMKAVWDKYSS